MVYWHELSDAAISKTVYYTDKILAEVMMQCKNTATEEWDWGISAVQLTLYKKPPSSQGHSCLQSPSLKQVTKNFSTDVDIDGKLFKHWKSGGLR